jgi:hypothetical protein
VTDELRLVLGVIRNTTVTEAQSSWKVVLSKSSLLGWERSVGSDGFESLMLSVRTEGLYNGTTSITGMTSVPMKTGSSAQRYLLTVRYELSQNMVLQYHTNIGRTCSKEYS